MTGFRQSCLKLHRGSSRFFALWLALLAFGACYATAMATPAMAGTFDLLEHACFASLDGTAAPAPAVARQLRYVCGNDRPAKGDWLWIRMDPPADTATVAGHWSLLLNETRLETLHLIVERASGKVEQVSLNRDQLRNNWVLGNMVRLDIPASASPMRRIYLGVTGLPQARLVQKVDLASETAIGGLNSQWLLMGGIFVGALTASLLYNLLLLGGVRHRLQLIYLSWMAATLTYGLSWSGLVHYLVPHMAVSEVAGLGYLACVTALALGVLFFIEFFGDGQLPQWLVRLQRILAGLLAIAALVATFGQHRLFGFADNTAVTLIVATQLLTAFGIVRAMEREPGPAALYGLGWSFPFVAVMLNLLWGRDVLGPGVTADAGIFIATVVQALLLSAATAVRLSDIRRDRDQARAESERLRSLAETDPLTALLNRRGLVHRAQAIMNKGLGSALILIDVDHFKKINDGFGHDVGDRVLIRVGELLERQCVSRHPVGRIGGEEFAIVVPADDAEDALVHADHIRRHLAGADFADLLGTGRGVTISVGLAVAPISFPATFERLYVAADRALYVAKNNGRNRVEIASIDDIRRAEARLATV